jgi:tetratricopeptide (TPR) repeat protein
MKKLIVSFFIICLFSLLSACATVKVPIKVMHPAEINMKNYKQIALYDFEGNMGQSLEEAIKDKLVNSERFTVVDRSRMNQIMKELNLSQSDLVNPENRAKLGKLISASAMMGGRLNGDYKENTTYSKGTCVDGNGNKYSCTTYYRKGIYNTKGSVDVIDVQTGQIIKSKTLKASYESTHSATNETPEEIDRDGLAGRCLNDNITTLEKAIMPWEELVKVPFLKDKKIPDLERGIASASTGDLENAIKIFNDAAATAEKNTELKPGAIASTYWDLGLAYEYNWDFDNAIKSFNKAYTFSANSTYTEEINNVKKLKAEKAKLDAQL